MDKVWTIAVREYRAIVGAKAFLIALVLMPVLMFAGIAVQKLDARPRRPGEAADRRIGRHGHVAADGFRQAAKVRNELDAIVGPKTERTMQPRFEIEAGPAGPVTNETRLELSDRARRGEIDSFVEIPADVFQSDAKSGRPKSSSMPRTRRWPSSGAGSPGIINDAVHAAQRWKDARIDPAIVQRAEQPVVVEPERLSEASAAGETTEAGEAPRRKQASEMQMMLVPFGLMMLMWMVIFLAAQPMLESVMEEKSQRIAEVLLGSVNCFQLMLGKLLGGIGGSLTVLAVYGPAATSSPGTTAWRIWCRCGSCRGSSSSRCWPCSRSARSSWRSAPPSIK